jgi:hypothetical protein
MPFGAWPGVLLAPPGRFGVAFSLAGDVIGQEVEQRAGLLAAQVFIERTARLGVFDRHDDRRTVQRVARSLAPLGAAGAACALLGVSRWS